MGVTPSNNAYLHQFVLVSDELTYILFDNRYLDKLFVMLDANFRLKSKDREIKSDPSLGSGLAYYVEETRYRDYLSTCPEQTEVSLACWLFSSTSNI